MTRAAPLIGISGTIAAGKSTLTRALAATLGFRPVTEAVDRNPYLGRYYHDPKAWGFKSFLFFFEQSLTDLVDERTKGSGIVQERLPQEHLEVFGREFHGRGYLSDDDIALFERLARTTVSRLPPPAVLVHLDVEPVIALDRLRARGRDAEQLIPLEYLQGIQSRYDAFVSAWNASPIVRVDTSKVDIRTADGIAKVSALVLPQLPAGYPALLDD